MVTGSPLQICKNLLNTVLVCLVLASVPVIANLSKESLFATTSKCPFHFTSEDKKDLQAAAGISWASVTKLSKGKTVSMEVLMKVCKTLNCDIGDIMELIPTEENGAT